MMRVSKPSRVPLFARVGKLPKRGDQEAPRRKSRRYGVAYVFHDNAIEVRVIIQENRQNATNLAGKAQDISR